MTESVLKKANVEKFMEMRNKLFRDPGKISSINTVLSSLNDDDTFPTDVHSVVGLAIVGFWALTVPDISFDSIKSKQRVCSNCGGLLNLD